jgi:DNA polymerase
VTLHHDFETRSVADLEEVGLDNYASHQSTRALMLSWAIDDGPVQLWQEHLHGPEIPEKVGELLLDPSVIKVAWNTPFERAIWRRVFGIDSPADEWQDPMSQARYLSLPGRLELAGPIGGLQMEKNKIKECRALLNLFSMPNQKGKNKCQFNDWNTHPEEWANFCRYCVRDTEADARSTEGSCDELQDAKHRAGSLVARPADQ